MELRSTAGGSKENRPARRDDEVVSFAEFLDDPMVHLLMKADHVDARDLAQLIRDLGVSVSSRPKSDGRGGYRLGVGIMLLNDRDEVFVGRRIDRESWQMPQGGIEPGEEPQTAAFRELSEEIGTSNAQLIAESSAWLQYDVPALPNGDAWRGNWRGQRQKWFVMRFKGDDREINLATSAPEFSDWRWVKPDELPVLAADFKRPVYDALLSEFTPAVKAEAECPFCHAAQSAVVAENELAFLIYDIAPATDLHMLAIPKRHVSSFFDLSEAELAAIQSLLAVGRAEILQQDKAVTGFNVGASDGVNAGQTVFHCHYHLLPRRAGDVADAREGIRAIMTGRPLSGRRYRQ